MKKGYVYFHFSVPQSDHETLDRLAGVEGNLSKFLRESALKQFPLKPKMIIDYSICPKCAELVHEKDKYCKECGQKLDWGKK